MRAAAVPARVHSLAVAPPSPPTAPQPHRNSPGGGGGSGSRAGQAAASVFPGRSGPRGSWVPKQLRSSLRPPAPGSGSGVGSLEAGRALRVPGGGPAAAGGGASPHWPGRSRVETRPFPTEGLVGRVALALTLRPPDLRGETLPVVGLPDDTGQVSAFCVKSERLFRNPKRHSPDACEAPGR